MTTTSPYTGTDRYMAYELLHGQETVAPTTWSDIFALGCIGLEVPVSNTNGFSLTRVNLVLFLATPIFSPK